MTFYKNKIEFSQYDKSRMVKIPNIITEDLAYLCGVLAGDGNINFNNNKGDYHVSCIGNPKDEKEYYNEIIVPLFKKMFNLDLKARYHDGNTTYGIRFGSKAISGFLVSKIGLPNGKKHNKLKIPNVFKNKKFINNFIQGLADTDFDLCLKKKRKHGRPSYPVIAASFSTRKFIIELGELFNELGFSPVMDLDRKQLDIRFKKGHQRIYRFELNGHKKLLRWIEIIGFRHPKMHKRINVWYKENKKKINKLLAERGFEFRSKNFIFTPTDLRVMGPTNTHN